MSGLVINIKAGATFEQSSVTATGSLVHIIADSERASFGIGSEGDLKRAVGKYFDKEPNDAFLHSPTPLGDLYKIYGWPQVQRVLEPKTAQILELTTNPTILATKTLTNESNKTTTFTTSISEQVTNSVSNEWTNSSKVAVEQSIKFGVSFLGTGGGGESTFRYEQNWGKSETVSKQTTVGMGTGVTVELKPGESAIVELSASSGTMRVRVTFDAHLTGTTAVNYSPTYKGHQFWGLLIDKVIGDSNKVQIVEDIEVDFYSNAAAKVKNLKTNEEMIYHLAHHPDEPPSDL